MSKSLDIPASCAPTKLIIYNNFLVNKIWSIYLKRTLRTKLSLSSSPFLDGWSGSLCFGHESRFQYSRALGVKCDNSQVAEIQDSEGRISSCPSCHLPLFVSRSPTEVIPASFAIITLLDPLINGYPMDRWVRVECSLPLTKSLLVFFSSTRFSVPEDGFSFPLVCNSISTDLYHVPFGLVNLL